MKLIRPLLYKLLGPCVALILSFVVGGVFIAVIGQDPIEVYSRFFVGTLGSWYGVGQVLFKTTPLIFTGLSAALAFRAGLFNIGAEGQLTVGAFVTALLGFSFTSLPSIILLPLCLLGGFIGGALWGAVPGLLKAKFGSHEVINTIMMNFVAAGLISYLVNNYYAVPATIHTPRIAEGVELPRLFMFFEALRGSPVNLSLFLALVAAVAVYVLLWKTRFGYEIRAMGLSLTAAKYAKIDIRRRTVATMAIAGGLAGLVGSNFVLGYKGYFELGFSDGVGFIGIAVALLGRNSPVGIILASVFFGILEYGGLTINTIVPKELVNILQAIMILLVIILSKVFDKWIGRFQLA